MKYTWDIIFSFIFAALMALGIGWLAATGRLARSVPAGDFLLMALAIFRLVRLFTYDHITDFIHAMVARGREGTLRGTLKSLIECPWCTGLWFSFVVVFAYYTTPWAWPVILILALAAAGTFLQILANLTGWYAEGQKRVVRRSEPDSEAST